MTGRILRGVAVTLLCGIALLLGTTPALAHARLESSDPADGASLDAGPERVTLTYNEAVQPGFATVTVVGPDGGQFQTGEVTADGRSVSTAVLPLGPAGKYEIGYRVVSADGHPITGSVAFTLTTPGEGAAAPATGSSAATSATTSPTAPTSAAPAPAEQQAAPAGSDDGGGGAPVWPWIAGAAVLVVVGVVVALRLGRG
jgi:copper resistance protein C